MIDASGEWMMQPTYVATYGGTPPPRSGARHASIAPYRVGDGSSVFLAVQHDREWKVLCNKVIGRPELVDDTRYASNTQRATYNDEITALLETRFSS